MSKIVDIESCVQCLAGIYVKPSLLEDSQYHWRVEDFTESLHKVIFSAISNLYKLGANQIDPVTIEKYLENREKANAIFHSEKGVECSR